MDHTARPRVTGTTVTGPRPYVCDPSVHPMSHGSPHGVTRKGRKRDTRTVCMYVHAQVEGTGIQCIGCHTVTLSGYMHAGGWAFACGRVVGVSVFLHLHYLQQGRRVDADRHDWAGVGI